MSVNDKVVIRNARIVFRNFAGEQRQFNEEGNRNFSVVLDDEDATHFLAQGWNVKTKPPREEGDPNFNHLKVTVSYRGKKPPLVMLISSRGRNQLDQDTISLLDTAEFALVDMIIRPHDWEVNGNKGRKAYLDSIYVTLAEDELALKYAEEPKEKDEEPADEGVEREED